MVEISPGMILVVVLILFGALGAAAAVRGIAGIIAENTAVKQETQAVITGGFMPAEKKQQAARIRKKGRGLRFKLASFTIGLVLSVIIIVSIPIYILMTGSQREVLLKSLRDRCGIMVEGLASSAKAYITQGERGMAELSLLPAQIRAMPEANYVTITGIRDGSIYSDHVLATNDPGIVTKIDTAEYYAGVSRIRSNIVPRYDISNPEIRTQPEFTNENIFKNNTRVFIFHKPVVIRQEAYNNYFIGLVMLEVSLDSIINQTNKEQRLLLVTISIVSLVALLTGIVVALIFSTLIIRPIQKLAHHIEMIRDTEHKAKLAGRDIHITSGDELAILGDTINDMTHGLVKAAAAAADLSIGKEIQKKFIPLDLDREGNKKSSGYKDTKNLNFFCYYEGAAGVSGDYFDYRELDERYYAIIKCDAAGKGIPAALIMIQVATMFLNYFKQWKPSAKGMQIEEVVYQINEFIETLAFKGRFAAFTLCLFDSETGLARFCNAGDNIIHLYDASEGRIKNITLHASPAAGVLPNFLIETTGGYKVQTLTVDKGDILLFYTDGIEESKRKFRDGDFKEILCTEGDNDTPHENHLCGQADEEMGPRRVEAIINAVMARKTYTLHKYHNPEARLARQDGLAEQDRHTEQDGHAKQEGLVLHDLEGLQFDFSSCKDSVEDVVMAMVSVEKMFRCYKNPKDEEASRVLVDKKIDEFLKNHFVQSRRYCAHTRDFPENDAYMYYTHLREDEQYDDLTILGIKRK
jgi:hypothetical protein